MTVHPPVGGSSRHAPRQTRDTTKLEPDVEELKTYCYGVGLVLEEEDDARVELMEVGSVRGAVTR